MFSQVSVLRGRPPRVTNGGGGVQAAGGGYVQREGEGIQGPIVYPSPTGTDT